jgi:hypothetical protein
MTFFLEIIIILGVGFNAYYTIGSYNETSKLLQTPKYRQYIINLKLLEIYYNNGKKSPGDIALSANKLTTIAKGKRLQITGGEVRNFILLCGELDIVEEAKNKRKQYKMTYNDAYSLLKSQESL